MDPTKRKEVPRLLLISDVACFLILNSSFVSVSLQYYSSTTLGRCGEKSTKSSGRQNALIITPQESGRNWRKTAA